MVFLDAEPLVKREVWIFEGAKQIVGPQAIPDPLV